MAHYLAVAPGLVGDRQSSQYESARCMFTQNILIKSNLGSENYS